MPRSAPPCTWRNAWACPSWSAASWPPAGWTRTPPPTSCNPPSAPCCPTPRSSPTWTPPPNAWPPPSARTRPWACSATTTWTAPAPPPSPPASCSELGCTVLTHVPDRMREGYGPNAPALLNLVAAGATLIVCVGLRHRRPRAAGRRARPGRRGRARPPRLRRRAASRSSPPSTRTAWTAAAGCGPCAPLPSPSSPPLPPSASLRRTGWFAGRPEPALMDLLDLVALATVCDVMPLTGLNRALVVQGLRVMAKRERPGLAALLDAATRGDRPTAMTLGFALGPPHQRRRPHRRRRAGPAPAADARIPSRPRRSPPPWTAQTATAARWKPPCWTTPWRQAEALDNAGHAALLVHGEGWHQGVVGIVAGRIKERHNRPALVGALARRRGEGQRPLRPRRGPWAAPSSPPAAPGCC